MIKQVENHISLHKIHNYNVIIRYLSIPTPSPICQPHGDLYRIFHWKHQIDGFLRLGPATVYEKFSYVAQNDGNHIPKNFYELPRRKSYPPPLTD